MANKNVKKNKKIKSKFSKMTKIVCLFLFVFSFLGGILTTYILTKNDKFEIIGGTEIILNIGEEYVEQGAKIIAFGKDISSQVKIVGMVDTSVADDYVLEYTVDNFRFFNYKLYKKITVKDV